MPKVLIACANGTEDSEFACVYDVLIRAGAEITVAKVNENEKDTELSFITKYNLKVSAQKFIEDVKDEIFDMIICPGGHPNSVILGKNKILVDMLKKQKQEGRWYAAICVAPYDVFEVNGLLEGEKGVGHPAYNRVKNEVNERVVISNKCITSQGPCTSFEFGFALAKLLFPKEEIEKLEDFMRFKP